MPELLQIILISTLITGGFFLGWWLLIASEGVYLGRRVVIWLYDLYAHRYDGVKAYIREYEQRFLAEPLMKSLSPNTAPLILDVATGTGRLPLAMAQHQDFQGHVVGIDLSRNMLDHAPPNLYPYTERATFVWGPAEALPFPDDTFDAVTCLEALEFMTQPEAVLKEMIRVMRPGGILLTTQRLNTRWMPGKTWSQDVVMKRLQTGGLEDVRIQIWQVDYRKVWGRKPGVLAPTSAVARTNSIRCPQCHAQMERQHHMMVCTGCQRKADISPEGIVELFPLY
jgi:ubiquinone/menaquinone biosynthesis C-methylase UbiE